MLRLLAAVAVVALALAGCSGKDPDPAATAGDAADPATDAGPVTSVDAPEWQWGQWWEWETTYADESKGDPFRSIVSPASTGDSYSLVTDSDAMAKEAAAFGHPLLSPVRRNDLAMSDWSDTPWSILSFPLTDGKTWTATIPNVAWDIFLPAATVEATFVATFIEANVGLPVVSIVGIVDDKGVLSAEYDPSTGWFRTLTFFDVDPGDAPLEISWRARSAGLTFEGTYYQHQAELLLAFDDRVGFDNFPTEGGQPYTDAPEPHHTFTMGEGTRLYGYLGAFAVLGARSVVLVDPANQERHLATPGAPEAEDVLAIDEAGQAGEWRVATAGAGGLSAAFAQLYELTLGQGAMVQAGGSA